MAHTGFDASKGPKIGHTKGSNIFSEIGLGQSNTYLYCMLSSARVCEKRTSEMMKYITIKSSKC
jgi:hypothetical protein